MGKLTGHVDIGPIRPGPERPGEKQVVSPEVYRRYTVLVSARGPQKGQMKSQMLRVVSHLKISDKGDFSTSLPAGIYRITVEPADKITRAEAKDVTIKAGCTIRVVLHVDTGIR